MTDRRPFELMATLWPEFPHFKAFAHDERLRGGIRLNSAMMAPSEIETQMCLAKEKGSSVPLFFDVKGRQLRIVEVDNSHTTTGLQLVLNHAIRVKTPAPVLFKGGEEGAKLVALADGGRRLIFDGGPYSELRAGESLHVKGAGLEILGPLFTDQEKQKIERVRAAGITRWFLSYVEDERDMDEFRELIGPYEDVRLKIESVQGLRYVARHFKKRENVSLVAARGDLFVEVHAPHQITEATKLIIDKDPEATVGSRILLSTFFQDVPSCSDFSDLEWLYTVGFRRMLLCDEMCLKGDRLKVAVEALDAFRQMKEEG